MSAKPCALADWLMLCHAPHIGTATQHKLLEHFGSINSIRSADYSQLSSIGLKAATIDFLQQTAIPPAVQAELDWSTQDDCHLVSLDDPDYPKQLAETKHPPCLLYVRGNKSLLSDPQLAIVGSRNPTAGGRDNAHSFANHFGRSGLIITSGLALGIDAAAHAGALAASAPTIAVMATGIDTIYPATHRKLATQIVEQGAIISEMPLGTKPLPALFPQRNRIISGLSLGVLVVEAAQRSGSLITARLASEQAREVFAVPGSIHNPMARGCHRLIRQGAKLVESAQDVLEELAPQLHSLLHQAEQPQQQEADKPADAVQSDHLRLLEALAYDSVTVDQLVERSGFSAKEVASMLLIMELEGLVQTEIGGLYTRSNKG